MKAQTGKPGEAASGRLLHASSTRAIGRNSHPRVASRGRGRTLTSLDSTASRIARFLRACQPEPRRRSATSRSLISSSGARARYRVARVFYAGRFFLSSLFSFCPFLLPSLPPPPSPRRQTTEQKRRAMHRARAPSWMPRV